MRRIAITGGVASGKTTVAQEFKRLGAYVVSCDSIVHQLLSPQHSIGQQVVKVLGPGVTREGQLDRGAIADRIFRDPLMRSRIEGILHPAVREALEAEILRCPEDRLFAVEIPLLFEAAPSVELPQLFDGVVCVDAPVAASREWARKAGMDSDDFDRREGAQLPREEKARRAHYIIANRGDPSALLKEARDLYTHLTQ